MPPSMPPARSVRRRDAVRRSASISSCATEPRRRRGLEAVADLDALDRLDAHERAGQPGVEPAVPVHVAAQARRQPVDDDLDDAAEGVAVLPGGVDLGDHRARWSPGRGSAPGRRRCASTSSGPGSDAVGRRAGADRDHVADHLDADGLARGTPWRPRRARPGRRSPGRWPARAPAGRRRSRTSACRPGRRARAAAGSAARCGPAPSQHARRRPGRRAMTVSHFGHSVLPILDRDRAAQGAAVPDAAGELDLVLLERHPRAAAVAEPAAGQGRGDVGGLTSTPAGRPSRIATSAGPCDSPAVSQRNMRRFGWTTLPPRSQARRRQGRSRREPASRARGPPRRAAAARTAPRCASRPAGGQQDRAADPPARSREEAGEQHLPADPAQHQAEHAAA